MTKLYTQSGFKRLFHATSHSLCGLKYAWAEAAFRQEIYIIIPLIILTFFLNISSVEQVLLVVSLAAILIVEVLNTAIESVVDRFGSDWNIYSKMAKDLGSLAVLIAILAALFTWGMVLIR